VENKFIEFKAKIDDRRSSFFWGIDWERIWEGLSNGWLLERRGCAVKQFY